MTNEKLKNIFAIKQAKEKRISAVCPHMRNVSGIYIFNRTDECGFTRFYVGQARHLLTRCAEHIGEYTTHLGRSIEAHGFICENEFGWKIDYFYCNESELDFQETSTLKEWILRGGITYNITSGGQHGTKKDIGCRKPSKGYYDGKKQGKSDLIKELNKVVKYLQISPRDDGKLATRMAQKFWEILGE